MASLLDITLDFLAMQPFSAERLQALAYTWPISTFPYGVTFTE